VRAWRWLLALPTGVSAVYAVLFATAREATETMPVVDVFALGCVAVVAAGLAVLAGPRFGRTPRSTAWPHALALLSAAAFGLRVVTLIGFSGGGLEHSTWTTFGTVEAAAAAVIGVALAVHTSRELRRLPTGSDSPAWSPQPP
jgi:hypothetical protein